MEVGTSSIFFKIPNCASIFLYIHRNFFLQDKISTNCGEVTSRGLNESEKRLATQLHNQLRAKLARGEEIRGHPGPQPSASNMMQMASVLLS